MSREFGQLDLGNGEGLVGVEDWSVSLDATPIEPGNLSGGTGEISAAVENSPDDAFLINNNIVLHNSLGAPLGEWTGPTRGLVDGVDLSPLSTGISAGTILSGASSYFKASPETLTGNIFQELIIPDGTVLPAHGTQPKSTITSYKWIDQAEDIYGNIYALGIDQNSLSIAAKFDKGGRFLFVRNIRPIGSTGTRNNIAISASQRGDDPDRVSIFITHWVSETGQGCITRYDENLEVVDEYSPTQLAASGVSDSAVMFAGGGGSFDTIVVVSTQTEMILFLANPATPIALFARWGTPGTSQVPGTFSGIKSISINPATMSVYVSDSRSVQEATLSGGSPRFIYWRAPGTGAGFPVGWNNFTAGARGGFVYVSTDGDLYGHPAITAIRISDGKFSGSWTPDGTGAAGFRNIRAAASGSLLATTRANEATTPGGQYGAFGVSSVMDIRVRLDGYIEAVLGASAPRSGLDTDEFFAGNNLVAYPGWEDSAWNKIKELLQVWDAELVLVKDVPTIFYQGSRGATFGEDSLLVSPRLRVNSLNSSRSFDMVYHNYEYRPPGSILYDGSANRDRAVTLDIGESVTLSPSISAYIIRDVESDVSIFDANRVEINANTFREWGGGILTELDPGTRQVHVTIQAPSFPSDMHPFPLTVGREREDGGLDGGLLIAGEAISFDDKSVNVRTSADPRIVTQEFGPTVNNFFISTLHDAVSQGSKTAAQMAGPRTALSATAPATEAPIPSGVPGRKLRFGDATYRITSADTTHAEAGLSLERHVTSGQIAELWAGKTAGEFRDFWLGQPAENIKMAALRVP